MSENERLRYRVVQLEAEQINPSKLLVTKLSGLESRTARCPKSWSSLKGNSSRLRPKTKTLLQRYVEVEEQNESLANLYVASHRLHSTLDSAEVVECIKEILLNMIGSEDFGLYVIDDDAGDLVRAGYEGDTGWSCRSPTARAGEGLEGVVAVSGEPYFGEDPSGKGTCACVPLKIKDRVVGVISIYALLSHKKGLSPLDHKLLELLAGHAASAIISSKLYSMADRKLRTIEGLMSLLRVNHGGENV
jgi:nitrate/nitrite-specific signal transduction histidine kinase